MDLLEDFFSAVKENNKKLTQEKFELLLINHEAQNIFFPGCSPKVFIENYPKPDIKEKLGDEFEIKYNLAVREIKDFFFHFGPHLSFSQCGLIFHYNLRKFEYLESLYMLERDKAFISFDSQKKHEGIFERFYEKEFGDVLQVSMIFRVLEDEITTQKHYLNYIEKKYGIKITKLFTAYSLEERSKDLYNRRLTTLQQIISNL